ncbi:hypothetical protein VCSRO64_3462 [Vibrio cholerae]|nr:hypothetical protein VCSRO107_3582 [Vibrio cholerae]GHX55314.1 hypothetical protein VCSRO64_3462 [Vibrio cholerae]GIA33280.1 hypothetical protein VCSRO85_2828 [Vibrio cholerae]
MELYGRISFRKCTEALLSSGGYSVMVISDGVSELSTVFFNRVSPSDNFKNVAYLMDTDSEAVVASVSGKVFDLLCEFRKQDEAPVMGADSSPRCCKCGNELIAPDFPLCMPCDISEGGAA